MQYEKYENVVTSSDFISYQFISIGPKGNSPKLVLFSHTGESNIYNLAFGNKLDDDNIDDTATDNNKDRNKILATVVSTVYDLQTSPRQLDIFYRQYTTKNKTL